MKVDDLFSKLRPVLGPRLDTLWQEYVLASPSARKMIEDTLRIQLARSLNAAFDQPDILLQPPSAHVAAGKYPLGVVYYGQKQFHPFGLREDELIQHVGIFGRSGSGKTNVGVMLALNFLKSRKPFLIFDWKRNYRDLLALPPAKDIMVFTVGREIAPFQFNPLKPPKGTSPTVWLKKLIDIMAHAYFLGEGCAFLLQQAIDAVYRDFGVYDGKPEHYPTMLDVQHWLQEHKTKGRESAWMESTARAVGVLCFGEMGRVLNSEAGLPMERLLEKSVILELDALTNSDKTFFIEALLLWIHHHRLAEPDREHFKHAILIEEAHHILLRKKQEASGEEAVTDILLREIRELGEAIVLIDQHPSLISKPGLGNTYCTIAMNLKHRADIAMVSDCLLFDAEQSRYLGKLEVGWGVVRLQGRWFEPFLVKFPLVRLDKGNITDEAISSRMRRHCARSSVVRQPEASSGCLASSEAAARPVRIADKYKSKSVEQKEPGAIVLTTEEEEFLRDVHSHPTSSIRERHARLRVSTYNGNTLQHSLLSSKLIFSEHVSIGKGRIKLLRLTNQGRRALGLSERTTKRRGGGTHAYWRGKVAEHFRSRGYEVTEEAPIGGGKTVDVVAENGKERTAIEIETGKADAVANAQKCLSAEFDRVICCAVTETAMRRLRSAVRQQVGSSPKIVVAQLSELVDT